MSAKNKLIDVTKNGLCNRCGTCIGLSQGKIKFKDKEGNYLPKIPIDLEDDLAKRIWTGCPAQNVNFPRLNQFVYNSPKRDQYLGHYRSLHIGFTTNQKIRRLASSGGIITQVLLWLLQNKKISGAVVLGMDEKKPWLTRPFIATTPEQIISAAGSKYLLSSNNQALSHVTDSQENLALVGIPPQVHSIRKLQMVNDEVVKKIKYIIGPFYGNTLHFSSIKYLLKSYGIDDHKKIKSLSFREGKWPGYTKIVLQSGEVIKLPKFYANYLIPFHIVKRSLLSTDLTNEFTDISVGDAWAPKYEQKGKGFSMVIVRSQKGQNILEKMQHQGVISLKNISKDKAIKMHSHGYDLKKRGAFIRIQFLKKLGFPVPDYGYQIKGFPFSRYLMEIVISSLFLLLGTKPARHLVSKVRPDVVGKIFQKLRTLWKKITYNIKRHQLINSNKLS